MPPSPTDGPSVITVENADGWILSVMFSREKFFCCVSPSVRPSVFHRWLIFISDKSSDGMGNYRRLVSRQTDFVGETIGNNVTDGFHALHRRN